ncbi:MAG: DMT family transporter [bacterium]
MILTRTLLVLTVSMWGFSFVATKICLEYMSPLEVIGLRYLMALPVLLLVILIKRVRLERIKGYHLRNVLLASGVFAAHYLFQVIGMQYTTATNTSWLIATTPLIIVVLAFLFLKERITRRVVAGVVVATIGILLLVSKGKLTDLQWIQSTGDWLVLASSFTWAIYTLLVRDTARCFNPLLVSFAVVAFSAVVIVPAMVATANWNKLVHLPAEPVVALVFLGVVCLALAYWFWQEGVARLGAAQAGIFLYLEPLAATALAVPYLHEPFGPFTAIGGLLVLAGVYLAERKGIH